MNRTSLHQVTGGLVGFGHSSKLQHKFQHNDFNNGPEKPTPATGSSKRTGSVDFASDGGEFRMASAPTGGRSSAVAQPGFPSLQAAGMAKTTINVTTPVRRGPPFTPYSKG